MAEDKIYSILKAFLQEAEIFIQGSGCEFKITVICSQFEGLNQVQRQRMIYQQINSFILDGSVHAVSMILMTPKEQKIQKKYGEIHG